MNQKENDTRVIKAEEKLKKLKALLEDRLSKTDSAMKEVKELRREIKKLKSEKE